MRSTRFICAGLLLLAGCIEPTSSDSTGTTGEVSDADSDGWSAADGDCEDTDPNISPTATDIAGDGVDQNCDGADGVDADGDGYASEASGGEDCDDMDPSVVDACDPGDSDDPGDDPWLIGDVTFNTAASMAAFCDTYVGIYGDVLITDVDSVAPLDCLTEIDGALRVESTALVSLALPALRAVGHDLSLRDNAALEGLAGLSSLERIGGALALEENPLLTSFLGLDALTAIEGTLLLDDDAGVSSLRGLSNLDDLAAYTDLPAGVTLRDCDALRDLDGLSGVTTTGPVTLESLPALVSLDGLSSLERIDGDLYLANADELERLDGLEALRVIGGDLYVYDCDRLMDIDALLSLDEVFGDFLFYRNRDLSTASIEALYENIGDENIYGAVYIEDNASP